ncbi:MAG: FtsX-like permease family protein [Spirochaetes bacterium]|nr:FtsX-like permease family protein [Spirochaetota bacterium]MBU0954671.1 FtsX-like permease family protein [Spirochaetota bacterium]
MSMLIKIAAQNLVQHRTKSLIIGVIIAVGVAIFVVGNSLISTASLGIERAFIDNFTGHIMISGKTDADISLFGVQSPGGMEETPLIQDYAKVLEWVNNYTWTSAATSQITGFAVIKAENQVEPDKQYFSLLFGVDYPSYEQTFHNMLMVEGSGLEPGQNGILLEKNNLADINERLKTELGVGDEILLTGIGAGSFSIRRAVIRGVFVYKNYSETSSFISYVDPQTVRSLKGLTLNTGTVVVQPEVQQLLDTTDLDSLFASDSIFASDDIFAADSATADTALFATEQAVLAAETPQIDEGAWEYILVRLKSPLASGTFIRAANRWFESQGIAAQASGWKVAAGPFSTTADVVRIVLTVAILMVVIVAIIIIMNTLVISVIERTSEVGTMRALGAERGFIRRMFTLEILVIAFVFGLIGLALGILILFIVRLIGFEAVNPFLEVIFAGKVLKPVISPLNLLGTQVAIIIFAILANMYPLSLALKIQPIKAMQSD